MQHAELVHLAFEGERQIGALEQLAEDAKVVFE